jgi:hypothetical protein
LASRQCVPGGIGKTNRSSRMDPLLVCDGTNTAWSSRPP